MSELWIKYYSSCSQFWCMPTLFCDLFQIISSPACVTVQKLLLYRAGWVFSVTASAWSPCSRPEACSSETLHIFISVRHEFRSLRLIHIIQEKLTWQHTSSVFSFHLVYWTARTHCMMTLDVVLLASLNREAPAGVPNACRFQAIVAINFSK